MGKREIETCHCVQIECVAERPDYDFDVQNEFFANWYKPATPKKIVLIHDELNTWFRMKREKAVEQAKEKALGLRRKKIVRDFRRNNPEYSISFNYKVFECTQYDDVYTDDFLTKELVADGTEHK